LRRTAILRSQVFGLALKMVVFVGRRCVWRGRSDTAASRTAAGRGKPGPADEELEDRLDDELRDID